MWGESLISRINQTDIAHLAEESSSLKTPTLPPGHHKMTTSRLLETPSALFRCASDEWHSSTCNPPNTEPLAGPRPAPPLPLGKSPPSAAIITGKEKRKQIQTLDGLQIIICEIPTYDICFWSLYIGGLLVLLYVTFFHHIYDMDIWKLKNVYTFCFLRLLLPSWLMYPNDSFKAFVHFLELGQFVMQFILEIFSRYWLSLQESNGKLEPYVLEISSRSGGGKLYTKVPSWVFLATKFCIVVIFLFKMNIISCSLKKTFIRNEMFWVMFTRCLFLAVVDKQIIYFIFERF